MFSLYFLHLSLIFNVLHKQKKTSEILITAIPRQIKVILMRLVKWKSNLNTCKVLHGFWVVVLVFLSFLLHLLPHFSKPGSSCCQALFQPAGKKQLDYRVTSFCSSSRYTFLSVKYWAKLWFVKLEIFKCFHLIYLLILSIVTYLLPLRFHTLTTLLFAQSSFRSSFEKSKP